MVTEPGDGAADHRSGRPDRSEPAEEAAQAQTGSTSMSGPAPAPAPAQPAWSQIWPPWTYWVWTTLAVVATLLVVAAARRISQVLLLALVAFVLAVGLDPAVQWLGKLRIRRGWAVAIIFVGLVVFLALFVALLIPLLAREVPQFAGALPAYLADLQRRDELQAGKAAQRDPGWQQTYQATRPTVERKIAHFTRRPWGGRKARCRGRERISPTHSPEPARSTSPASASSASEPDRPAG